MLASEGHTATMRPQRVWYLAYGSNLDEARFLRYLQGGETEPGARDATPPTESVWASAPFRVGYAKRSQRWGGGVAFATQIPTSVAPSHAAIVRAWSITGEQFEDVFAQENGLPIGTPLDWLRILRGPVEHGTGWYRRILGVDIGPTGNDDVALTFTWHEQTAPTTPNHEYVATIRRGLTAHPDLSVRDIDKYMHRLAND